MKQILQRLMTRRSLLIATAALLLYALAGFGLAPVVVRWYVPRYVQQSLHCRASLEQVRINPFLLSVTIKGFRLVQDDGQPLIAFGRLFADLEASGIFRWAVVLRKLDLDLPEINIVIERDGAVNLEKLAPPSPKPPAQPTTAPLRFLLQDVAVQGGQIALVDKRQSTPADLRVGKLNLRLKDVATIKGHNGTYSVAAMTEDGESLTWEGEITAFPFRSKGKLALNALRTASLWQFVRDRTNLEPPAGRIAVSTGYQLDGGSLPIRMTLDGLKATGEDISLRLLDAEKPLFQVKKVDLDAASLDPAARELHLGRLLVQEGAVAVRIDGSGLSNMQRIVREQPSEKEQEETPPASASSSGAVPEHAAAAAPAPETPALKVRAEAIELKDIAVSLDDTSRTSPLTAAIGGIDLRLQASLDVGAQEVKGTLHEMSTAWKDITVYGAGSKEPLFATEKLTVEGGECDLGARSVSVARIALVKGHLDAGRDADGAINWLQLVQTKGGGSVAPAAGPDSPAWRYLISSFEIDGFNSKLSDLTTGSAQLVVSLQGITVRLGGIDGKSPMGFKVDCQAAPGGDVSVSGTVNPAVPSVEADVQVSGLAVTSLQPYIDRYVGLVLQSASVSTHGRLRYGIAGAAAKTAYEGDFSLNKLSLAEANATTPYLGWDAVEMPKFKLTLQPNGFEAQEIRIGKPVGEFIIGEDKVLNLARVIKKQPAGDRPSASAQQGPKSDADDFPFRVAKVRVENGNVVFADLSLRPKFRTRIHDLKGSVVGLSSDHKSEARIQLDGQVDTYGTAKIKGALRPYDFKTSTDIGMVFRNLEMTNLSPYSGKFAGRLIRSGKVAADLKYRIKDSKVEGDNKIIIHNLVLGEQVDHPGVPNLPLDLAIALLQDSSGRIDIGLPITGDLNDPQFSIGPLIWKLFSNLITKAVSAPFRALGGLFAGEQQFDVLEFDPGGAELSPPGKEKLVKIGEALRSRPQLRLVIQGRYSPAADGLELRDLGIRKIVAARRKTADLGPLDFTDASTQHILEDLYAERLGKAALDELDTAISKGEVTPRTPARQRDEKDRGKDNGLLTKMAEGLKLYTIIPGGKSPEQAALFAGELYTRLVEKEHLPENALLQLAGDRAQAIAREIEAGGLIPKERVSTKTPEAVPGDEPPSVKLDLEAL